MSELSDKMTALLKSQDQAVAHEDKIDSLRQNLLIASDTNPDQYAEATRIGEKVNVPPAFVEAEFDQYRKDHTFNADVLSKIVNNYPQADAWLAKQDNAKLAYDDIGPITTTLDIVREFSKNVPYAVGSAINTSGVALENVAKLGAEGYIKGEQAGIISPRSMALSPLALGLTEGIGQALQLSGSGYTATTDFVGIPPERQNTATKISNALGSIATSAATFSNPILSAINLTSLGAQEAIDTMNANNREEGPAEVLARMAAGATTNYVTERISIGALLGKIKGMDKVLKSLPKDLQNKYAEKIIDFTAGTSMEVGQELLQGVLQDAIAQAAGDENVEYLKDWKEQALVTGGAAGIFKGLVMAVEHSRKLRGAARSAEDSVAKKETADAATEAIKSSKLHARMPEKMAEILKAETENEQVTLDSEVVRQFYQDGIDPTEAFDLSPSFQEQFDRARLTGEDINIPLHELLAMTSSATEAPLNFITDYIKSGPEAVYAKQAIDQTDEINARIKEIVEDSRREQEQIQESDQNRSIRERVEQQIIENLTNRQAMGEKTQNTATAEVIAQTAGRYVESRLKKGLAAGERTIMERMLGERFKIFGPNPVKVDITSDDFYIDKLREKEKRRAYAEEKAAEKRAEKKGFFGFVKAKKEKATPTPLINALIKRGGIRRGTKIAAELESIGITPKAYPRLFFANQGMRDIDNIPVQELEDSIGGVQVFSRAADLNGYVDRNELLERLRDESFGKYIKTEQQIQEDDIKGYDNDILSTLSRYDVDIKTATNKEVKDALAKAQQDFDEEQNGQTYYQKENITDTPEFKKWFDGSKVVDENGDPLVVYHGTPAKVNEDFAFDYRKIGTNGRMEGSGFYFTGSIDLAKGYADNGGDVVAAYLNIKKPIPYDLKGFDRGTLSKILKRIGEIESEQYNEDIADSFLSNFGDIRRDGLSIVIRDGVESLSVDDKAIEQLGGLLGAGAKIDAVHKAVNEITGYDGFISDGFSNSGDAAIGKIYVAFFPEQIKSVYNRGTFDPNDSRILYQKERASVTFDDETGRSVIRLFEKSDPTSILHEMSHIFLDIDAQIAGQHDAPESFKQEFADCLKWLGAESYDKVTTEQHEKFARGFEAYLYEGKAPVPEIQSMFDRLKMFFIGVYKSVKDLGVKITPQARSVFDRLFATDEAIEAVKADKAYTATDEALNVLNAQERAQYERIRAEQIAEAKTKLLKKALRQKQREDTQYWKEERESYRAAAEKSVQSYPIQKAIQVIKTGKDFDGNVVFTGPVGLDEKSIIRVIGDNGDGKASLKYFPKGTRAKEGGIDIEVAADMFGYKNVTQFIEDIVNAPSYKSLVEEAIDTEMIARHGDMLSDGAINDQALNILLDKAHELAMIELKSISDKAGRAYPTNGDFSNAARQIIGAARIDNATAVDKYHRAAIKAAREYGKAIGEGRFEDTEVKGKDGKITIRAGAITLKSREILNKHLYSQAKEARALVNKSISRFDDLNKRPPRGKIPAINPEYHKKIWEVLAKFNLGPRLSDAKRLRLEMSALNSWIREQEVNAGASLMIPPEILAADSKQHYRDLTFDEFIGLRDLVTNLETQGRDKQTYIMDGKRQSLEELTDQLAIVAAANNDPQKVTLSQRRTNEKIIGSISVLGKAIDAVATKIQQVAAILDGGENYGIWTRTIFEPVQKAEVNRGIRARSEYKKLSEIMDRYYKGERGAMREVVYGDGENAVTREYMLSIALHQGTEGNRQKLLDGYERARGWDQAFIDRILSNMRKKDWQFVMDMRDYLDTFWQESAAVEERRFGYAPEKVQPVPDQVYQAVDGEILVRGGYMRIMYDADQDAMAAGYELEQTFNELRIGKASRAQTRRGSMIERVQGVRRPIRLDLDVISEHISEVVGIITMAETVDNVAKVLSAPVIQDTLHTIFGRERKGIFDTWIKDVAVGGALSGGTINKILRGIRTNYTISRLALKPATAILQFSGLSHTLADIGLQQTAIGLKRLYSRGNPFTMIREIQEKSLYMKERRFSLTRDTAAAINAYTNEAKNIKSKLATLFLYPMQKTQEHVDAITWLANYDKAINEGMEEKDAIRYGDLAVSRTQGGGLITDLSAIERGTLNETMQRSEWVKASTLFYSYFNAKYNLIKNKNTQFRNKKISALDLAGSYAMAILAEGLISSVILGGVGFDWNDDDELSALEVSYGLIGTAAMQYGSSIPFLREFTGAMQGFTNQTAAEHQIEGLGNLSVKLGKLAWGGAEELLTGESETLDRLGAYGMVKDMVEAASMVVPMPAAVINQFIRGMEKEDKTGEASILDYLVYQKD